MENPAKFMCQNKGRNTNDKTMKALANDIPARIRTGTSGAVPLYTTSHYVRRHHAGYGGYDLRVIVGACV